MIYQSLCFFPSKRVDKARFITIFPKNLGKETRCLQHKTQIQEKEDLWHKMGLNAGNGHLDIGNLSQFAEC
ncbi:hypothetical protein C7R93_20185 [Brevibacillus fortis]|uniref:Uncharacterized protein n=1 Tax=Brevibacillus fortis TaxID=2126352 RepID=A0A2P7UZK2_9BACL|nr:hypothetical protein C7R93_20185 [Brevibacillus fortis]